MRLTDVWTKHIVVEITVSTKALDRRGTVTLKE